MDFVCIQSFASAQVALVQLSPLSTVFTVSKVIPRGLHLITQVATVDQENPLSGQLEILMDRTLEALQNAGEQAQENITALMEELNEVRGYQAEHNIGDVLPKQNQWSITFSMI